MENFLEHFSALLQCSGGRGLLYRHEEEKARRPGMGILNYVLHCPWFTIKGFFIPSAQSPPRGPGPSVSAGGKTCWSIMVACPGTTSTCPSAMTWVTSPPCSAMGRVTSAGVWTKTAERCRAPAPSQEPPLHVSTQGQPPLTLAASEVSLEGGGQLCAKVGKQGVNKSNERSHYCAGLIYYVVHPRSQFGFIVCFCH